MALLLNVSYSEKEQVKALGARWNPELKRWYVTYKKGYYKLRNWFANKKSNIIICDNLYVAEGEKECFACKKKTPVIALATNYYVMDEDYAIFQSEDSFQLISYVDFISSNVTMYLKERFNFFVDYSNHTKSTYYSNHCKHCGRLQGDFFVHSDVGSPFLFYSEEDAKKIRMHEIPLSYDIEISGDMAWSSSDELIGLYAKFIDSDFNVSEY